MNTPNNMYDIPDWKLERYLLGELPREELDSIRQRSQEDPSLNERLQALKASDKDIRDRYPAAWMDRKIRNRIEEQQSSGVPGRTVSLSRLWTVPTLSAAAVIILLFALVPTLFTPDGSERGIPDLVETTRVKGLKPELLLFRKTETGSERLEDGVMTRENDLLLIQYQAAGRAYGAIVSFDGRGRINRHFPDRGQTAGKLEKDGPVPLEFSYELDDAPYWERFYFITSDQPFEVATVIMAIRQLGNDTSVVGLDPLELPDGLEQSMFTVRKEEHDE